MGDLSPPRILTEHERASQALAGDDRAMDWLVGHWMQQVHDWCARLGAPEPEEAAVDVMLLLVRRRATVSSARRLPGWILGTCRRVVANHRRRAWWRRWVGAFALDNVAAPSRADQRSESRERADRVEAALEGLRPAHREVLVLCYIEERPLPEVAELLGIPVGTVKSRLFHARARFAERFGDEE